MKDPNVIAELHRIAEERGGQVRPSDLVEEARVETSPLHSHFQWEDSEAAHQYRLWQARQLLRVTVQYIGEGNQAISARVFVSLSTDRKDDGGYRVTASVMQDPNKRQQMLDDALAEMKRFEKKYETLEELAGVFAAMRKVSKPKKSLEDRMPWPKDYTEVRPLEQPHA